MPYLSVSLKELGSAKGGGGGTNTDLNLTQLTSPILCYGGEYSLEPTFVS